MHINANKGCSMGYHLDQIGMEKVSDQQKKKNGIGPTTKMDDVGS